MTEMIICFFKTSNSSKQMLLTTEILIMIYHPMMKTAIFKDIGKLLFVNKFNEDTSATPTKRQLQVVGILYSTDTQY